MLLGHVYVRPMIDGNNLAVLAAHGKRADTGVLCTEFTDYRKESDTACELSQRGSDFMTLFAVK